MNRVSDLARDIFAALVFIALLALSLVIGYLGTKEVFRFLWEVIG